MEESLKEVFSLVEKLNKKKVIAEKDYKLAKREKNKALEAAIAKIEAEYSKKIESANKKAIKTKEDWLNGIKRILLYSTFSSFTIGNVLTTLLNQVTGI